MSFELYPQRASEPDSYEQLITFTGAGAATPTKNFGKGVAITWVSTGLYRITFTDPPGNMIDTGGPNFQATTPGDLKGYSAVFGLFDSTGKIVQVSIYNSTFTLADLQLLQTVGFAMVFKRSQNTL